MANIDDIESVISKELGMYCETITTGVKDASDDVMKELVNNTKNDAPVRKSKNGGKYKKAITSKRTKETSRARTNTWYVKDPQYKLSHLLEKGHATRSGGRTKAFGFISKNEEIAIEKYDHKVEEVIKNES